MNERTALLIGFAALAGIGAAIAATRPSDTATDTGTDTGIEPDTTTYTDWGSQGNPIDTTTPDNTGTTTIMADINIKAFLGMIRKAEGTERAADPYRVCYAYKHTVQDMSDHPAVTGEWKGEPLSAGMCISAGRLPGCVSTAAGAYQFIKQTWVDLRNKLGLDDFTAESQDEAATELLRRCGALERIKAGDIEGAISKARKIWASFPAAGYNQGERTVAWMVNEFQKAGGTTA